MTPKVALTQLGSSYLSSFLKRCTAQLSSYLAKLQPKIVPAILLPRSLGRQKWISRWTLYRIAFHAQRTLKVMNEAREAQGSPFIKIVFGWEQESLHGSYRSVATLLIYPDPRTDQWSLDRKM